MDEMEDAIRNTEFDCPWCEQSIVLQELDGWKDCDDPDICGGTEEVDCPYCSKPIKLTTDVNIEVDINTRTEKGMTKADKKYKAWKEERDSSLSRS